MQNENGICLILSEIIVSSSNLIYILENTEAKKNNNKKIQDHLSETYPKKIPLLQISKIYL